MEASQEELKIASNQTIVSPGVKQYPITEDEKEMETEILAELKKIDNL